MPIHPKISPSFVFAGTAEQAAKFYVSVFPDARIIKTTYSAEGEPGTPGQVRTVSFELMGQYFIAANGDDSFAFGLGLSLYIECETQAEIDTLTGKLTAGGGRQEPCGWVIDKFGVAWQIAPRMVSTILDGHDDARADRMLAELFKMRKLDIATLERAARRN